MNYEEKYKEALEKLRAFHRDYKNISYLVDVKEELERIFPELRESEDEKIRKGLIKGLSAMRDIHKHQTFSDDAINIDDALTWLEKQGEQKFWSEEDELMIQDAIHWINEFQKSNRCKDENDMQNSVTCENWLKSLKDRVQPQQVRREEDEKKIMWLVRLISTAGYRELETDKMPCSRIELLDWLKAFKDRVQFQPKQEWSEEDEMFLFNIIKDLERLEKESKIEQLKDVYSKEINWLKSIKDRVHPQLKQEWSKEQKQCLDEAIYELENLGYDGIAENLKSLKPHWKPSEQNIKDLEWCADLVQDKLGIGFHRLQVFIDEIKNL